MHKKIRIFLRRILENSDRLDRQAFPLPSNSPKIAGMTFRWLKPYMPGTLYGRATLILLLPVISVLLVVSIVFVQRHFDGVTSQMTNSVSREVRLMLESGLTPEELAGSQMARTLQKIGRAHV